MTIATSEPGEPRPSSFSGDGARVWTLDYIDVDEPFYEDTFGTDGYCEVQYSPIGYEFVIASAQMYVDTTECSGDLILDDNGEILDAQSMIDEVLPYESKL